MNHPRPLDLAQRDLAYIVHPYTNFKTNEANGPFIIDRGEGVYVYDNDGRRYLEGMAGLWSTVARLLGAAACGSRRKTIRPPALLADLSPVARMSPASGLPKSW